MPLFLSKENTALLIHIPKTGGSSVEHALSERSHVLLASMGDEFQKMKPFRQQISIPITPQHLAYQELRFLLGGKFPKHTACVVRNPYERIESSYAYSRKLGNKEAQLPFNQWVFKTLAAVSCQSFIFEGHFRKQSAFVGEGVKVFRFEEGLEPVIGYFEAGLGLSRSPQAPHENASAREAIQWLPETRLRVNEFYQEDFIHFNYPIITPKFTKGILLKAWLKKTGYLLVCRLHLTLAAVYRIWLKKPPS